MERSQLLTDYLLHCPAFDWAEHNCWHFAFDWIHLATGVVYPGATVGPTPNLRAAHREIRLRGATLSDAFESVYERPRVLTPSLTLGDVVAATVRGSNQALGVCIGRHAAFSGPQGVVYFEMRHMLHGWRV